MHQLVRQAAKLGAEVGQWVVEMAVGEEGVHKDDPLHRSPKAKLEAIGLEALLHCQDVLTVPVVAVDDGLRQSCIIEYARTFALQYAVTVVHTGRAILVILEGDSERAAR